MKTHGLFSLETGLFQDNLRDKGQEGEKESLSRQSNLLIDGPRMSPENKTSGSHSANDSRAVLNLAAPPAGSIVRGSML